MSPLITNMTSKNVITCKYSYSKYGVTTPVADPGFSPRRSYTPLPPPPPHDPDMQETGNWGAHVLIPWVI